MSLMSPPAYFRTAVDWESLVSEGMVAREQKDQSQWRLGELADQIETVYGMDSLGIYSTEISISKNTLRSYRDVFRAYRGRTKFENLSFSHHLIALKGDNPEEWLKKASDNSWSCEKLSLELSGTKKTVRGAIPEWCERCQGWKTRKLCKCSLH